MRAQRSYLLLGTPRTGSTLLCGLLASTGVAGRPESYFREPDQHFWARHFGVPIAPDGSLDYRAFVRAAVRAGSTPNGIFSGRIMWGTMHLVIEGLGQGRAASQDIEVLEDAFGPLLLVYLKRADVVAQAVSWARAEQTGYWQHGDVASAEPHLDLDQIDHLVRTIGRHNAAWSRWFTEQSRRPHVVTYEELVANPSHIVTGILNELGVAPRSDWRAEAPHCQQADSINTDWIERYEVSRSVSQRPTPTDK